MRNLFFAAALLASIPVASFAQTCGGLSVNAVGFTPTSEAALPASTTSSSVALGSSGAKVVVTNIGTNPVYVILGDSSVSATTASGYPVLPSSTAVLTVGSATYAAAVTSSGTSVLRLSTGN